MRELRRIVRVAVLLSLGLLVAPAWSQSSERADLKERFKERYPHLEALKSAGKVGEGWNGFVAEVEAGADRGRAIVEPENDDRRALYLMLAENVQEDEDDPRRERVTPRVIAERNAWRNFQRAGDREPLAVAKGVWVTKKDRPWLLALLRLVNTNRVGETEDGYVAVIREDDPDPDVARVVSRENEARRKQYERLARERNRAVEDIAREHARLHLAAAHVGAMTRTAGQWKVVVE